MRKKCKPIRKLLVETVHVAKCCGVNEYAEKQHGEPEPIAARVHVENSTRETDTGTVPVTNTQLWTEHKITTSDLVWLPGTDCTDICQARVPKRVDPEKDINGCVHHYKAWF